MHGGHMDTMSMPLLPVWLRLVWVVALCGVVALHVGHAWAMPGQRRWWHVGHIAMASGMALMYALPRMHHAGLYRVGLLLFALVTVALGVATAALWRRESAINPLWMFSTLDMLVMSYMLLPSSFRTGGLTALAVAYLACQIVAWSFGLWDRLPPFRRSAAGTTRGSGDGRDPTLLPEDPAPSANTGPLVGLTTHSSRAVRVTLAVMAASMAYMLAVM